jgi:hypothetical protein
MSAVKTFVLCLGVWIVTARPASAEPIIGGPWTWTTWRQGQILVSDGDPSPGSSPSIPVLAPPNPPPQLPVEPPHVGASSGAMPIASVAPLGPNQRADAFLDLGASPFAGESVLTGGGGQPWHTSPVARKVFGGDPSPQQQAEFARSVLERVGHTYRLSGLTPRLTLDPSDPATNTLSVVSNTSYPALSQAIGIADVGGDGFSFIDKLDGVKTVDELAWAVAHNVAHELLHSWGVGEHHDTSGNYIDSATASWALLTNPSATFSPLAIEDLLDGDSSLAERQAWSAQLLDGSGPTAPQPVPEPATLVLWTLAATAVVMRRSPRAVLFFRFGREIDRDEAP